MDYQPKLLKYGFGTLLGSLIVVALLVIPSRAGATDISSNYFGVAVPSTLYWGPPTLAHGALETFTDHSYFQTTSPFAAQFQNNFNNFSLFSALTADLHSTTGAVPGSTLVLAADANTPTAPFRWTNAAATALGAGFL